MSVPKMSIPPFDLQAYEPPLSLWQLVLHHVPEHEQEEIKNMLGESLVDQSLELHAEIDTLLEIWRDYRDETESTPHIKLPEPPGLRDRLIKEIQFFVENVREKAKNQGVNADRILKTRHNMDVIDYAVEGSRPGTARGSSRPGTAMSREGRETPMITTPTSSDRMSLGSTLSEEIESMNDKLNFIKFDEVVQHLRSTLEEEIETLHRDIRFLYDCLDEEADYRAESEGTITREPTLSELQQERSRMEKELLSDEMKTQASPPLTKPAFDAPSLKSLGPALSGRGTGIQVPKIGSTSPGAPNSPKETRTHIKGTPDSPKESQTHVVSHKHTNQTVKTSSRSVPLKAVHSLSKETLGDKDGRQLKQKKNVLGASNSVHNPVGVVKLEQKSSSTGRTKIVMVGMASGESISKDAKLIPSPPSSAKPPSARPSSAERFRRMVYQSRDTT